MVEKNVHQIKKDLLKEINFLWHAPTVDQAAREEAIRLLGQVKDLLKSKVLDT